MPEPDSRTSRPDRPIDDLSVDKLVEYLLAAKRSLSTVATVMQANEIVTTARQNHEDCVIFASAAAYLETGLHAQFALLRHVLLGLAETATAGGVNFQRLISVMDDETTKLTQSMDRLRAVTVEEALRSHVEGLCPPEGAPVKDHHHSSDESVVDSPVRSPDPRAAKTLIDYAEVTHVDRVIEDLKKNISELLAIRKTFDEDIALFQGDLEKLDFMLQQLVALSHPLLPPTSSSTSSLQTGTNRTTIEQQQQQPEPSPHEILASLIDGAGHMANNLISLTDHFDKCTTAVRATEGGTALALQRAAERPTSSSSVSSSSSKRQRVGHDNPMNISRLLDEEHSSSLEPMSAEERDEILRVVVDDADIVDKVVGDINERLAIMQAEARLLQRHTAHSQQRYQAALQAVAFLHELSRRVPMHVDAETEFRQRWTTECALIYAELKDLEHARYFYKNYLRAYDALLLEVERRRRVEEQILSIWRRAQASVDRLQADDQQRREHFMSEHSEYIPTDLYPQMADGIARWVVRRKQLPARDADDDPPGELGNDHAGEQGSADPPYDGHDHRESASDEWDYHSIPTLPLHVLQAARERLNVYDVA